MTSSQTPDQDQNQAQVELRTKHLLLRSLTMDDVSRLAQVANDKRVARNMTGSFPHPYTTDDAVSFIQSQTESEQTGLAIVPLDPIRDLGPGMVGVVGSNPVADTTGVYTFGYWLGVDAWGRGFATEAAAAYLDHLIATTNPLRRLEAAVYAWNPASSRVLEKLGFEFEGRKKARVERFGDITDELWYGKIP